MQQRFCDCGCAVWVQYLFPNTSCRIIFKSKSEHNVYLTVCPRCGRNLNIDDLH